MGTFGLAHSEVHVSPHPDLIDVEDRNHDYQSYIYVRPKPPSIAAMLGSCHPFRSNPPSVKEAQRARITVKASAQLAAEVSRAPAELLLAAASREPGDRFRGGPKNHRLMNWGPSFYSLNRSVSPPQKSTFISCSKQVPVLDAVTSERICLRKRAKKNHRSPG